MNQFNVIKQSELFPEDVENELDELSWTNFKFKFQKR